PGSRYRRGLLEPPQQPLASPLPDQATLVTAECYRMPPAAGPEPWARMHDGVRTARIVCGSHACTCSPRVFPALDANRWNGNNRGGYSNPRVDAILDRLVVTIDTTERLQLHKDLLREQMGDVALIPLYWNADPVLAVKGLTGTPPT